RLFVDRLFWRLPVDDTTSISYIIDMLHLTGEEADAYRERRRKAEAADNESLNGLSENILAGRLRIEDAPQDMSMYKLFWIEDYATQVGQGANAERPT